MISWIWERKWWILLFILAVILFVRQDWFDAIVDVATEKVEHADKKTEKIQKKVEEKADKINKRKPSIK